MVSNPQKRTSGMHRQRFAWFLAISVLLHAVLLFSRGWHLSQAQPPGARAGGIEVSLDSTRSSLYSKVRGVSKEQQAHSQKGSSSLKVFSGSTSHRYGSSGRRNGARQSQSHPVSRAPVASTPGNSNRSLTVSPAAQQSPSQPGVPASDPSVGSWQR